jgi:mono/diheme cytochrome c family protein
MPTRLVRLAILLGAVPGAAFSAAARAQEAPADDAQLALGRAVFTERAQPSCAVCHRLADAGAEGAVGPSLDDLAPDADRVEAAVTGGLGIMPAFAGALSPAEIDAVAAYVAAVAGR